MFHEIQDLCSLTGHFNSFMNLIYQAYVEVEQVIDLINRFCSQVL